MPWNEEKLASETAIISSKLMHLNRNGVLTINSQPRVNGESSTHPQLGWGKPGGYVYQKVNNSVYKISELVIICKYLSMVAAHHFFCMHAGAVFGPGAKISYSVDFI